MGADHGADALGGRKHGEGLPVVDVQRVVDEEHLQAPYALSGQRRHLALERGEIVSLIGPSGSGKSTLLRVLTGLLNRTGRGAGQGRGDRLCGLLSLKRARERLAIVFQQYNLFGSMTVLRNVTVAPIQIQKRDRRTVEAEARALLTKVGLADKFHSYPDQLSGGQQQRVAIARALCLKPEILLLDEVASALDPERVAEVLDAIKLLAAEHMTLLIVSHDMGFVREVSHRAAFMADGRIQEIGPPEQIFSAAARSDAARSRGGSIA